jgi:hypothetical protein
MPANKPANKNEQVIVAFFDNQFAADVAMEHLKAWDEVNEEIKLGATAYYTCLSVATIPSIGIHTIYRLHNQSTQ